MVAREIKKTLDEMMWRSFALGSTVLKQYELTLQQALALGAIVRLGPDVDMGQVSDATLLAPSTTTSVVDRLLQRGLVERSQHLTDRRKVLVSATRNGEYLAREMEDQDLKSFLWLARDIAARICKSSSEHFVTCSAKWSPSPPRISLPEVASPASRKPPGRQLSPVPSGRIPAYDLFRDNRPLCRNRARKKSFHVRYPDHRCQNH